MLKSWREIRARRPTPSFVFGMAPVKQWHFPHMCLRFVDMQRNCAVLCPARLCRGPLCSVAPCFAVALLFFYCGSLVFIECPIRLLTGAATAPQCCSQTMPLLRSHNHQALLNIQALISQLRPPLKLPKHTLQQATDLLTQLRSRAIVFKVVKSPNLSNTP